VADLIPEKSLMVWNNTRVIQARFLFTKPTGSTIEVFLLEPHLPHEYSLIFSATGNCAWNTIIGNRKKWKQGDLLLKTDYKGMSIELSATEIKSGDGESRVQFSWNPSHLSFAEITEIFGKTPLPPYINRPAEEADRDRYQTVYARINGSVAAPTAGLHFTPQVIDKLVKKNIAIEPVTLHVGAGTFVPVKAETIAGHAMHAEIVVISKEFIEKLIDYRQDQVTAVGTTSVRSLESLYWLGIKLIHGEMVEDGHTLIDQWFPYGEHPDIEVVEALQTILDFMDKKQIRQISFSTRLLIAPGYRFRIVGWLITNFHQPGSTLLLLIAAFTGKDWRSIYNYALSNGFRFLSYGDSSILEINKNG
jgi:S-adenosylmethionine:tRNA ribosyltransferase-isomerase